MNMKTLATENVKVPPAPQVVTDAWMLYIGFEADPAAIKSFLPLGLESHPNNMVVMNMYTVHDAFQTSGFGAYTLTYLTVQVKDHDAYTMGSSSTEPSRYWAGHLNYFGLRKIQKNGSEVTQIMKFPIPYISRAVKTEASTVTFNMPENHRPRRLNPTKVKWAAYVRDSFVYSQAEVLNGYQ
jgi:hypothetical protein